MGVSTTVRTTSLPSGEQIPVLGQSTWRVGEGRRGRPEEIATLRHGLDLGMAVVDTAEMYGDGAAEELVAEAIAGRRDEVFLVSKVLPEHATEDAMVAACEASLRRLRTDRLDLYLLHWRGRVPLTESLDGFARLLDAGLIRHWGVCNFHVADMAELVRLPGGDAVATDQILYSLAYRAVEFDLLPWCLQAGLPVMAYSPLEHGRLLGHPCVEEVAARHDATPAQVAIAWVLEHEHVVALPQSGTEEHVRENRDAVDLRLGARDLADLNEAFPAPIWPARPKAY